MPTPNPPRTADRSPLPQVPDHAAPKTLQSEYTRPQSSTPTSSGTSASYSQESDIDQFDGYNFEEYDEHIRADLGHRVFVDFEVFLKRVLHVPENWREKWGQAIEAVKANKEFNDYHKKYRDLCNKKGGHDAAFYDPLTQMVNSVLEAVASSRYGDILPERHQYYRVNNPGHPPAEVINKVGPSPDQVLLDKDRAGPYFKAPLDWANPLQVFEVKPYDNAILDGRGIPRLIVGGVDPLRDHAEAPKRRQYRTPPASAAALTQTAPGSASGSTTKSTSKKQRGASQSASKQQSASTRQSASNRQPTSKQRPTSTSQLASKKRSADGSFTEDTRGRKRPRMDMPPSTSIPPKPASCQTAKGSAKTQEDSTSHKRLDNCPSVQTKTEGGDCSPTEQSQESVAPLEQRTNPELQVYRRLSEMLSVPLLRSHANVSLVDRDRLQLYHANRSVILVSSAINFAEEESEGKDKFIATVLAFHRLSLEQSGIIGSQIPGLENTRRKKFGKGQVVRDGNELYFPGGAKAKGLSVILGDVVVQAPEMVGRSTVVLDARVQGRDPTETPLVVKASWPTSGRASETAFLEKACGAAVGKHAWAANHLPQIYRTEDIIPSPGSTPESVASLFDKPEFTDGWSFVYERRDLRIIVQEELVPLRRLPSVREIGQVFLDVACVHHWLYTIPGILHCDISPNNIMCRYKTQDGKREVYGVLMDFDLSSWKEAPKGDDTRTPQERSGTPPYMARDLLMGISRTHLYRHDLESLFYVMLLTATRHSIGIPEGWKWRRLVTREVSEYQKLPFYDWFDQSNYETLGALKGAFFYGMMPIDLSPDFQDFGEWLEDLQHCFAQGLVSRPRPQRRELPARSTRPRPAPKAFDEETLGGCISYGDVVMTVPHLTGELKGIIVRDPEVHDAKIHNGEMSAP